MGQSLNFHLDKLKNIPQPYFDNHKSMWFLFTNFASDSLGQSQLSVNQMCYRRNKKNFKQSVILQICWLKVEHFLGSDSMGGFCLGLGFYFVVRSSAQAQIKKLMHIVKLKTTLQFNSRSRQLLQIRVKF